MNELNHCNILIIDDTEANIDILVDTLGDDYEVSVAMDGESAIEDVRTNPPDLILLDIMMPGIDGYEVCRRLKADEKTKDIPIIFITALSQVEDETKGLKLGAVDYITKPISPPIVKARVENHLELKQARENLERQNNILQENIHLREEIDRISRHDLKTPLNSIISIPRILLQDSRRLAPDQVELLEMIEQSGHIMLNMINLSLDMFKMEKGSYKLNPVPLNILSIIKKILFALRSLTDSKEIKFNLFINDLADNIRSASDCDIFGVLGEELLCYSMFANLIKNAVEASSNSATVTIKLFSKSSENEQVKIVIHNKGVVPASIRDNFFEKYATAEKKGGTGLGTYSAKLMAQKLGGEISMSTSEVDGTTITVTLKYSEMDRTEISDSAILSKTSSAVKEIIFNQSSVDCSLPQPQLPQLRIMVVDDDEHNQLILKKYLNYPEFDIELADNGQAAINKFKERNFDLIFMDMEMPVMDGIEAVSLIRKWESEKPNRGENAIIIALSGHDDPNTCQNCLDIGFDAYLSKPVNSRQLREIILKFFKNKNQVEIDADLEDLIPSFMGDKKSEIEQIQEVIRKSESPFLTENGYQMIQKLGHKLKGGFNMYGFKDQGSLGSAIEEAAKQHDFQAIKNSLNLLESSLSDIQIRYVNID
ncbi:MAG: response regulator [Desulfamplus sp.]|nr:response regulator [Desulfamplus sp.]